MRKNGAKTQQYLMPFNIRLHTPTDIPQLKALDKRVKPYHPKDKDEVDSMYARAKAAGAAGDPRWMAQGEAIGLDTPDEFPAFWVAEDENGQIVGTIAVDGFKRGVSMPSTLPLSHRWTNHGDVVELLRLRVDPTARGLGLGEELCQTVIDWAGAKGYRWLVVNTTTPQAPARQLYRKMGFQEVETTYIGQYELIWSVLELES